MRDETSGNSVLLTTYASFTGVSLDLLAVGTFLPGGRSRRDRSESELGRSRCSPELERGEGVKLGREVSEKLGDERRCEILVE